jgi:hypothetical protein
MVADVAVSVVMTEVVVLEAMVVVVIVVVVVAVVMSAAMAAETGPAEAMPAKVCRRGERGGDLFLHVTLSSSASQCHCLTFGVHFAGGKHSTDGKGVDIVGGSGCGCGGGCDDGCCVGGGGAVVEELVEIYERCCCLITGSGSGSHAASVVISISCCAYRLRSKRLGRLKEYVMQEMEIFWNLRSG